MGQYKLIGIAMEMGYIIALPLIGLALLGSFLDKTFNSKPLFLLVCILFAIVTSTILVYRKTKEMIEDSEKSEEKTDQPKKTQL